MAKHTPPDDRSFALSLVTHLGAAVALVAVVAAAFWGIGQVRAEDGDDPVVAAPSEDETAAPVPTDVQTGEPTPELTATAEPTDEPDVEPTEAVTDEPSPVVTETATEAPSPTPTSEPSPTATAPATGEFDPSEISVQVLDAVLDDGGEASKRVMEELQADGYRVVARNQAVKRYDVTTVMYTAGNEAKARQIAAQYGFSRVEPQPGNLSEQVDIHLVVGADAA